MPVKVSVVVPVYNPGEYIEDCIASLLRQSLPQDEFEAIFVDDGSTDGTPERLDRLAVEHPHITVIHQQASGWSGRPRNVGTDAARGEYVMYVDNDDWLGDEALERMYEYGVANDADVVVGKMAGKGRPVPLELFRVNRPRATVEDAPLMDSLTPHKMFRKSFLAEKGIRFKEGRRRLEDHVFVVEAYLRAGNVAVLSDYLCYYHVRRDDASNAGFQQIDPVGYFGNLREALDVVERYTEPGPLRDKLFSRWLRSEMVERLRGRRLLSLAEDYRGVLFREIRNTVGARFGPGVAPNMAPLQQVVAALVVADRLADIEQLARWETGIKPTGRLQSLEWERGALRMGFTAEYEAEEEAVLFRAQDDRDLLLPPLSADALEVVTAAGVDLTAPLDRAKVDVVVRERETAAEFFQPVDCTPERVAGDDRCFRLVLDAAATVDPETAANGAPLGPGVWDVLIRLHVSGWSKEVRLGSVRADSVDAQRLGTLTGSPERLVLPYWTKPYSNLSFEIDVDGNRIERELRALAPADVRIEGTRVVVPVRLTTAEERRVTVRFTGVGGGRAVDMSATLAPAGSTSLLTVDTAAAGLSGGTWRLALGIPSRVRPARWARLPLEFDASGGRLVAGRPGTPAAPPPPPTRRRRRAPRSARKVLRALRLLVR